MIIKEGSVIKIVDGNDKERAIIDKIIANEDIRIEDDGSKYTFLLRHRDSNDNCIFESEKIYKVNNEYIVEGWFKDAILVVSDKKESKMYESYCEYDD